MATDESGLSPRLRESGVILVRSFLDRAAVAALVEAAHAVAAEAPLFRPRMSTGTPFRYEMTNCGEYGWLATPDPGECVAEVRKGYYYDRINPYTGRPWPPMPEAILRPALRAAGLAGCADFRAETCLVNLYRNARERLGIHQDVTERNKTAPVVSLSAGDTGVFQVGGASRDDALETILLESGDCVVLSGPSRLFFHKFDRLLPGTGDALKGGGRLNFTIRQVEH